jgi:hypothetical protein
MVSILQATQMIRIRLNEDSVYRTARAHSTLTIGMEHRGIEYNVVQGTVRDTWRWVVTLPDGGVKTGVSWSKPAAQDYAKRAINEALGSWLVPPAQDKSGRADH